MYRAKVYITFKPGVLDPQGSTIRNSLEALGFQGVAEVRSGKYFEILLAAGSKEEAEEKVAEMCARLLANPVLEEYAFTLEG